LYPEKYRLIFELQKPQREMHSNYQMIYTNFTDSLSGGRVGQFESAQDYYPFGMLMPSRTFSSDKYRFGYNGQEKDDEVSGNGNTNTAEFWEYDTRLGRRWNLDPKPTVGISDYACFSNNPIYNSDVHGDTLRGKTSSDAKEALGEMKKIFGENNDIFKNYFTLGDDEKTFNKITSPLDFNKWLHGKGEYSGEGKGSGFNKQQIALANGFMKIINAGFSINMEFVDSHPLGGEFEGTDKLTGTATIPRTFNNQFMQLVSGGQTPLTKTQSFVHEVLGEGYAAGASGDMMKFYNLRQSVPKSQWQNNLTLYNASLLILQIDNIYNQMHGIKRSGTDHWVPIKTTDSDKVGKTPSAFSTSF